MPNYISRAADMPDGLRAYRESQTIASLQKELRDAERMLDKASPWRTRDLEASIVSDANEAAVSLLRELIALKLDEAR